MVTISFVIPLYNEEKRLEKTFTALNNLDLPEGLILEKVIFVNDGSTDRTGCLIKNFINCHPEFISEAKNKINGIPKQVRDDKNIIQIISYKNNRGKGHAVRQGMFASNSDYTLFFDADVSTPLSEIKKFMSFVDKGLDVIIGTRKSKKSKVIKHQPFYREILGKGYTKLSNVILSTNITDFTCGFKVFSKDAKSKIFSKSMINRWGYDSEILFLATKLGFKIAEIAVIWENDKNSKVNVFRDIPKSLMDLVLIRLLNIDIDAGKLKLNILGKIGRFLRYAYLNL